MKGQLQQAAVQLDLAAGPRREFFPASFFLGAAFAEAGRDREAAGVWQLALGSEPRPPAAYAMLADARFRDGQPQSVVDVLKPAYDRTPTDDQIARRLGLAYVVIGRYADAVPVLDRYLDAQRHRSGRAVCRHLRPVRGHDQRQAVAARGRPGEDQTLRIRVQGSATSHWSRDICSRWQCGEIGLAGLRTSADRERLKPPALQRSLQRRPSRGSVARGLRAPAGPRPPNLRL